MKRPDDYSTVAREIEAELINKGLWTRAYVIGEGNDQKTKAAYIRLRVRQIAVLRMPQHWRRWRWKALSILLFAAALAFLQTTGRVSDGGTGMCFIALIMFSISARRAWVQARDVGGETTQR